MTTTKEPVRQQELPDAVTTVFEMICRSGHVKGQCVYSVAKTASLAPAHRASGEQWFLLCICHGTRLRVEAVIEHDSAVIVFRPFAIVSLEHDRLYAARCDRCEAFSEEAEINAAGIMLCPACRGAIA